MPEQLKRLLLPLAQRMIRGVFSVRFDDLLRTEPISRSFGLDRGLPVDRFYIEEFLRAKTPHIQGVVLEIGERRYTHKFGRGVTQSEILHVNHSVPEVTIVGDLTDADALPADRIDCFICTQTLNFIFDVPQAIRGAHRLLKPGGALLATVAGISQISRYDMDRWGDYWRFTSASIRRLFEPVFTTVEITTYGNLLAAKALLDGVAAEEIPDMQRLLAADPDYQVVIGIFARK